MSQPTAEPAVTITVDKLDGVDETLLLADEDTPGRYLVALPLPTDDMDTLGFTLHRHSLELFIRYQSDRPPDHVELNIHPRDRAVLDAIEDIGVVRPSTLERWSV